jgi:cell cycle arrest protein BUB2
LRSCADWKHELRPFIWSVFLNVNPQSPGKYISYLSKGHSELAHKIRNDTPRTLATDPLFRKRVTEGMLRRVLNALDTSMAQRPKGIRYVQGMNVLAAPFLYVCGSDAECMAFELFERFIVIECPMYVRPTLEGVHRGLKVGSYYLALISQLLDICLHKIEPKLYSYLRAKKLQAELYAFPCSSLVQYSDVFSCSHLFGMHTSALRGATVMGFPPGVWRTHEHSCYRISAYYPS